MKVNNWHHADLVCLTQSQFGNEVTFLIEKLSDVWADVANQSSNLDDSVVSLASILQLRCHQVFDFLLRVFLVVDLVVGISSMISWNLKSERG